MTRWIGALALIAALGQAQNSPTFDELGAQARKAYEAGRADEAAGLYQKALKLKPAWTDGWWALGILHYENNRYPECRDALTSMTKLDASAAPGWALLGLCEFQTKQYELSFEHLKKAHMLVPPGTGGDLMAIADYHLGLLLTRQGAFEVSQVVFVNMAPRQKTNQEMMFGGGLSALRMAVFPEDAAKADREVIFLAGKTLWDLATEPPATTEADFKVLLSKYPKFPNVHYLYGTYLAAHHPEDADQEFLEELKVSPDSVPARVQLVLRYLVEQRLDAALKAAQEAVSLSPDSVGAQLALGRAYRASGEDEKALNAFLAAKKLDPISPEIRLYLMTAYRALGRVEEMRQEEAEHARLKASQKYWP